MIDTCSAFYPRGVDALFDTGMHTAVDHADTLRSFFASATVASRQWFGAGAFDWLAPVVQQPHHGGNPHSPPPGTAPACVSSPELAADRAD
jgi:hypothetical protein